jgi:hypothetical protein
MSKLLQNFARPFISNFFPAHAALTLMHCTAMLLVGPEEYHAAHLLFLKSLFQASNLELGSYGRSETHLSCLKTLVLLLEGGKSAEVLEMLDTVLEHLERIVGRGGGGGGGGGNKGTAAEATAVPGKKPSEKSWPLALDGGGEVQTRELLGKLLPIVDGHEACKAMAAALQECVNASRTSGHGQTGWAHQARFLPFVQ